MPIFVNNMISIRRPETGYIAGKRQKHAPEIRLRRVWGMRLFGCQSSSIFLRFQTNAAAVSSRTAAPAYVTVREPIPPVDGRETPGAL